MIVHHFQNQLDGLQSAFEGGSPAEVIAAFTSFLDALEAERAAHSADKWKQRAAEIREHPVFAVLSQCPMTRHSLDKPRGYPGDAALLDWIYYPRQREMSIGDPTARYLYHHNVRRTAPAAVRARVKRIAKIIDEVREGGSMLALACGHFREAEFSTAIRDRRLGQIDVVDQDSRSLDIVRARNLHNVNTIEANVMRFPRATKDSHKYDLVYAAGLFDYFSERMAHRVANRLWSHVAPGGVLCIPNYNSGVPDAGYLECFMDWWLIYRNREEMVQIGMALPADSVASTKCELLDEENVWYLQAQKVVVAKPTPDRNRRFDPSVDKSPTHHPHATQAQRTIADSARVSEQ